MWNVNIGGGVSGLVATAVLAVPAPGWTQEAEEPPADSSIEAPAPPSGEAPSATEAAAPSPPSGEAPSTPEAPAPSPPSREAPSTIEEVLVTGERVEATDIQDEAQAITAFGMEDLDRANIINVENLAFNVPGLHVGLQGSRVIVTLRGIGTENAFVTGEPGVAYHVDGVNYARPSAAQVAFFDLEAVRVQRGPQGLMGGKNTTSGSIHVVTRKPHEDYEASGDIQIGSYNQLRARAALNVPLGENLQTRFSGLVEDRDGYQENLLFNDADRDAFDADDYGFRQHLRFTPTDSLDLLFTYNYYRQQGNGTQVKLIPLDPRDPCPGTNSSLINRQSQLPSSLACFARLNTNPANPFEPKFEPADESVIGEPDQIKADQPASRSASGASSGQVRSPSSSLGSRRSSRFQSSPRRCSGQMPATSSSSPIERIGALRGS